jgi:uncharacterized protein DUF4352
MDGIRSIAGWGFGGVIVIFALVAAFALVNRHDQHAGLGEEIQYDDFAFSVTSASRPETVGRAEAPLRPKGAFVVVALRVANHAKRVGFRFQRWFAVLEDADGRRFSVSPEGEAALEAATWKRDPCAGEIPAGAACDTLLVYDVPPDARDLRLKITMGGNAVTEFLDWAGWGDKWIRIE